MPNELSARTLLDGRYRIEASLGKGGFALTYKALDERTGLAVAIKELFPRLDHGQALALHSAYRRHPDT
jgi:serine/threonine protein kinase